MTPLQTRQLEQSKIKSDLAALLGKPELTDEDRASMATLTARAEALEVEVRAAILASPDNTQVVDGAEHRELSGIMRRANLGKMIAGIADDGQGSGPERELRQALHMPDNYVPLAMLEQRAAVAITGSAEGNTQPWIQRIFPDSAAAFCGVDVFQSDIGDQLVPVIGTGVTIGEPGRATAQAESSPGAAITTLTPRRLTGNFPIAREDLLRFPGMEEAWRAELNGAVQNAIDVDLLRRNNKGLLDVGTDPTPPTSATTSTTFFTDLYEGVDGTYANGVGQVRMLIGPETYVYAGGLAISAIENETVIEKLSRLAGGVFVSDNVGAYASNRQEALVVKGGPRRNSTGTMWQGVEIIRDEVTGADAGTIKFTVAVFWDFEVLRAGGYIRKRYRRS